MLQVSQKLSLKQKRTLASKDLSYWASEFVALERGSPLSFKDYPYLIGIYQDSHPKQVFIKATQLGLSTYAALRVIYGCINKYPLGAIYFFPTDSAISAFSKGRITPLIENNPVSIKPYVEETDTVGLKRIKNTFLHLKGMGTRLAVLSVPADIVIFDELDNADPELRNMARKRMSASAFKEEISLSNPSIPGYGVDYEFQLSDQKYFLLKCPHCGEYNCVEETFPDCLTPTGNTITIGGRSCKEYILSCSKCKKELDKTEGEWVAKYPKVTESSGYRLSQLISPTVSATEIYNEYKAAQMSGQLTAFYNMSLGMAYVTAREKLEVPQILALCDQAFPEDPFKGTEVIACGIDQGADLHVAFKKWKGKKCLTWFAIEKDFEALDKYVKLCGRVVIDALPETRLARALADRFPGKVFLNYYNVHQKGSVKWTEDEDKADYRVEENRTESLDTSHSMWAEGINVIQARSPEVEEFAQHLANTAKKLDIDAETGSKRFVYIKIGPDHFRHADNYATIALNEITSKGNGIIDYV